ncbi:MAG: hypothetical protein KGI60_01940 [Patescibacteria group bacterium]|nr:hypothetical protein [Patescibacteria group bacterium]
MTLNERTKSILAAAVKEHIKTGEPVSSKELVKNYDFGVKAATVRNELNALTKGGFLMQPHTSGGRIPTDKGYQFFVESTYDDLLDSRKLIAGNKYQTLAKTLRRGDVRNFIDAFSKETKLLGVGQGSGEVYKTGLNDLFSNLDVETKEEMCEIINDFELLDRRLASLKHKFADLTGAPRVYIGKDSPITQSKNLSVIMDSFEVNGEPFLVAIIGPKRMHYDKYLQLMQAFHEQE